MERHGSWVGAAACLSLALAGCGGSRAAGGGVPGAPGAAVTASSVTGSPASLQPGDAIRLRFGREPDQSGTYRVDETGTATLPFLGARRVTDVPASELRAELRSAYLAQLRNQSVEITPLRRVRVLGEVRQPGVFHADPTMTLADVVAQAGGVTENGDLHDLRIVRRGREIRSGLEPSRLALQQLDSGDQVLVPKRNWLARNQGTVIGAAISAVGFIVGQAIF